MGKQKIKMGKIENILSRHITFSKRRRGLEKKAQELSVLCEAQVAIVSASPAGKLYQFSSSNSIDNILDKFGSNLEPEQQQDQNKKDGNSSRALLQDKINFLRLIKTQYLQNFTVEEVQQLEMTLLRTLERITAKKVRTTDSSKARSREPSRYGKEPLGRISRMNPIMDPFGAVYSPERWIPPPTDIYKVNFAGTGFQDENSPGVGVGVVVRNWKGDFMAALAKLFPHQMDVNTASWEAAKCATEFAVDYDFTHIILEGDNVGTMKGLQIIDEDKSTINIPELKDYMMQLGYCFFSHVQTSGNAAAHMAAQYARYVEDELVWLMEEPKFLVNSLQADAVLMTN